MSSESSRPLWQKNTSSNRAHSGIASESIQAFLAGDDSVWDTILLPYDITASAAHAQGLVSAGVLDVEECTAIREALAALQVLWSTGDVRVSSADEDCHTVIENYLVEALGNTGKKIHAGRSRNDQVLAALRLYLSSQIVAVAGHVHLLIDALCSLADSTPGVFLPGYTHFQRAMPSSVALWALGFAELLCDDLHALVDARKRTSTSPLGSAAGYGVPFLNLPRESVARELGFERIQHHATTVQLSRGKIELHAVHAFVQVASTINRLASDLILFNSTEFSFIDISEALTTGSSIMPQKRNPDVLEIARASVHRIVAEMNVLLHAPANLPSGYHRDLQLTKEATMRATEKTVELVAIMVQVIPAISFNSQKIEEAKSPELFATAVANRYVTEGVAFRDAYQRAATEKDDWASVAEACLQDLYVMSGQPGREDPDFVRTLAREAYARFDQCAQSRIDFSAGTGIEL